MINQQKNLIELDRVTYKRLVAIYRDLKKEGLIKGRFTIGNLLSVIILSEPLPGAQDKLPSGTTCAICGELATGKFEDRFTIRESWIQSGGYGYIPPEARVHQHCDMNEQLKILSKMQSSPFDKMNSR